MHYHIVLQAIGCSQLYKEFIVDATGWPLVEGNPSMSEGWEHPLYPWLRNVLKIVRIGKKEITCTICCRCVFILVST